MNTLENTLPKLFREHPNYVFDISLIEGFDLDFQLKTISQHKEKDQSPRAFRGKLSGDFETERFGVINARLKDKVMVRYEYISRIIIAEYGNK